LQTRGSAVAEQISEKIVGSLPAPPKGNKLHYFSGATLQGKKAPSGFAVRVTSAGTKAFVWFHRVDGKPHWETLGRWDENAQGGTLTVRDAIVKCDERAKAVTKGVDKKGNDVDPRPERTRRLQDGEKAVGLKIGGDWRSKDDPEGENKDQPEQGLLDIFIERYAKKNLRSADMIEQQFRRLVKPRIGDVGIYDLKRSRVSRMLDEIADANGERMADLVLAYVRKAFNWYEVNGHDDDFRSPVVRGMARTKPKERKRKRILADDEIRDLWTALDAGTEPACFAPYVKSLLLCATRRNESAKMHTAEFEGDLWTIPGERYKNKLDHVIPLTPQAKALISGKPAGANGNSWFVFSTTGGAKPFSGFSKAKRELDKAIANIRDKAERKPVENWTLHDLRRTARSLMSRAKVPTDHAERALGHVMGGVRETYDRYEYLDEKREAFEALAALVERVLNPTANVEELASRRGQA
jgi:integrase